MRQIYLVLFISIFVITSASAGIPDDEDLLLWIGEGSGNKAVDGTGNGNDGTFSGAAEWVAGQGKYAAGISLRGAESFMEVPNVITEAGSLLFWFKPDWDGKDGKDYRIFDASLGPIYFFVSKGANHADINPEDFGFYFEAADDGDWQDIEFDPQVSSKKMNGSIAPLPGTSQVMPRSSTSTVKRQRPAVKLLVASPHFTKNRDSGGKQSNMSQSRTGQRESLMKSHFGNAHLKKMRFRR